MILKGLIAVMAAGRFLHKNNKVIKQRAEEGNTPTAIKDEKHDIIDIVVYSVLAIENIDDIIAKLKISRNDHVGRLGMAIRLNSFVTAMDEVLNKTNNLELTYSHKAVLFFYKTILSDRRRTIGDLLAA